MSYSSPNVAPVTNEQVKGIAPGVPMFWLRDGAWLLGVAVDDTVHGRNTETGDQFCIFDFLYTGGFLRGQVVKAGDTTAVVGTWKGQSLTVNFV